MLFSQGSLASGPKVETRKALILVDFQQDFTAANGRLLVPNTGAILKVLPNLISKFREDGYIVWAHTDFSQIWPSQLPGAGGYQVIFKDLAERIRRHLVDRENQSSASRKSRSKPQESIELPELHEDAETFLGAHILASDRCCVRGTPGADISSDLSGSCDRDKDLIVQKSQYSALANFSTVVQLRARMVNDLYVCGSLSNIGVHATVLDAVQQGFNVTLIEDCLGFRAEVCHVEAMRRMADDLGASGIDYQELMDDLHGLLGDVVPESQYTNKFQLSMHERSSQKAPVPSQKVNQRIRSVEDSEAAIALPSDHTSLRNISKIPYQNTNTNHMAAPHAEESSLPLTLKHSSSKTSPSRKRSTTERDDQADSSDQKAIASQPQLDLSTLEETDAKSDKAVKKNKTDASQSSSRKAAPELTVGQEEDPYWKVTGPSKSTSHLETVRKDHCTSATADRAMSQLNPSTIKQFTQPTIKGKKASQILKASYLDSNDEIGAGDTKIVHDILQAAMADEMFNVLKDTVVWQKMLHRTGEVPRLVAVQGDVSEDRSMPIYRHPADESPPLLPFSDAVDLLRGECEKLVGHTLNHVLIQYYRNSEDNISEHSDKTLDIVRGSSIVNLSLGAMRTMTLRRKKAPSNPAAHSHRQPSNRSFSGEQPDSSTSKAETSMRAAQRVRLPHNSLFILGERTNADWLHSIRADKRPVMEKSSDERAFNGERISLTFRLIGTFINVDSQLIWGQGATSKDHLGAQEILKGAQAEATGEEMIVGFGKENHLDDMQFDWDKVYGGGFDVVNFQIRGKEEENI